jgi:hypothetical protein
MLFTKFFTNSENGPDKAVILIVLIAIMGLNIKY